MTLSNTPISYRYQGNGTTSSFDYNSEAFSASDLIVKILTRETGDVVEVLTLGSDYSVTIHSNGTATVLITNETKIPSATQDLFIIRSLDKTQTADFPTGNTFPTSKVEGALDKLTGIAQESQDSLNRSIKLTPQQNLSGISTELPSPTARKALIWNDSATSIVNSDDDYNDQLENVTARATAAAASATSAASSATAASTSESNASTSETNASTYATNADTSATEAAASAAAAEVAKIEWRGVYSAAVIYSIHDAVEYEGSSYVSLVSDNSGNTPDASPSQWDLMARKGTDGTGLVNGISAGDGIDVEGTVQQPEVNVDSTVARLTEEQTFSGGQRTSETTLTSSSNSVAIDFNDNNDFKHTLSENTTFANPSNMTVGQKGRIAITQDSTARTLAFGSYWKFPNGATPEVSTGNGAIDMLYYDVRTSTFIASNLVKGFA
jgi:hypothetical protein